MKIVDGPCQHDPDDKRRHVQGQVKARPSESRGLVSDAAAT